jgi:hypothetical protein
VRVRGAGYDKELSFGGTDGGPTHTRRTQTSFIARTPDISPARRGYTWETRRGIRVTRGLDARCSCEFQVREACSECSNCTLRALHGAFGLILGLARGSTEEMGVKRAIFVELRCNEITRADRSCSRDTDIYRDFLNFLEQWPKDD